MSDHLAAQRTLSLDICRRLRDAGHEALWAGGCVRDTLLGIDPADYDVATSATPDQVRELFGQRRTLAVGAAFGVIVVLGRRGDDDLVPQVEVATFRRDGHYPDGRRPEAVTFCDAEQDALRRDFTINALFLDPLADGEPVVIDYVGGQADLDAKVIRAVGDPAARIEEDKLRMLRAVRFAVRLADRGFRLDDATAAAIAGHTDQLPVVSPERILQETQQMLTPDRAGAAIELLRQTGLLRVLLVDLYGCPTDDVDASDLTTFVPPGSTVASWSRLLVSLTESQTRRAASRMAWPNDLVKAVVGVQANAATVRAAAARRSDVIPLSTRPWWGDLLNFAMATAGSDAAQDRVRRWADAVAVMSETERDPPPLLTGADLIASRRRPGPRFKTLLEAVRRAQFDDGISTIDEAWEIVERVERD